MSKPKTLFISPQLRVEKNINTIHAKNTHRRAVPTLSILALVTELDNAGYPVKYLDSVIEDVMNTFPYDSSTDCYGIDNDQILSNVIDYQPDIVGISCLFTAQWDQVKAIAKIIKEYNNNIIIISGGNHASLNLDPFNPDEHIDYIIQGEAEQAIVEFVKNIQEGKSVDHLIGKHHRPNNLDELIPLNWDLLPLERYWTEAVPQNPYAMSRKVLPYETSRGCFEKCTFCSTAMYFGKSYRVKSAEVVIRDLHEAKDKFGAEEIEFIDDNIAIGWKRFGEILVGIKDLDLHLSVPCGIRFDYMKKDEQVYDLYDKMIEAGFYNVTFPIESGNDYVLNHLVKKGLDLKRMKRLISEAKRKGLWTHSFFIIGFPYETREQINDTIKYAEEIETDSYSFSIAAPFPATPMAEQVKKEDLWREGYTESDLILGKTVIKRTDDLSCEELESMTEKLTHRLNSRTTKKRKLLTPLGMNEFTTESWVTPL